MTTFDTLRAARDLEAAGMDRKQAEAVASAVRNGQGDLATRADLAALRADVRSDMAALESRLTWRMIGVVVTVAGLLFAALRLVP